MAQRIAEGITVRDGVILGPLRRSVNQAQGITDSIHNDATAAKLGFRGGTVAGSIHLELFPPVLLEAFGDRWFERGTLSVKFRNATTDKEPVRAHVRKPTAGATDTQVDAWIEREDGMLVGEGSASVGDTGEPTALQSIDLSLFEAENPRILAEVKAGDAIPEADIEAEHKHQLDRLGVITEPLEWYSNDSPWGGPVASPATLVHYLYFHPARVIGRKAGNAVGLFGAIEVRHVNGPLVLDRRYKVGGEILAVGESPKTEYVWFESYADTPDGERVAEMRMQLRWMKASSSLYTE
ncbi:MAG: hypothetical protein ACRDKJ_03310 [Actinomycetota bacterium]